MIHQDCLSYNLVFTSKAGDSLLYVQNSRSTFTFQINGISQSRNAIGYSVSTRLTGQGRPPPHEAVILHLMEDFVTRKSSNEHDFFIVVTSLNMIGEERIRDLTGDIPFPVTSYASCSLWSPL